MSERPTAPELDQPLPLGQHLMELRAAILYPLIIWGIGMTVGLIFQNQVVNAVLWPVKKGMQMARYINPDLPRPISAGETTGPRRRLWICPNGDALVLRAEEIYRMSQQGELLWEYPLYRRLLGADYSSALDILAFGDSGQEVTLLDAQAGKPTKSYPNLRIDDLAFDRSGKRLVVVRTNGEVLSLDSRGTVNIIKSKGRVKLSFKGLIHEYLRENTVPIQPINYAPLAVFIVIMKASLIFGLIPGLPFLLYSLWKFVRPGLYARERRIIRPLLFFLLFLFFVGAAFAYFMVVPVVSMFLYELNAKWTVVMWDIEKFVNLPLIMMLAFGTIFELPLGIVVLTQLHLVLPSTLARHRRIVWVGMFVLGAILTPPEPFTQCMLALPTILLFEIGLKVSRILLKKSERAAAAAETE